LGDRSRRATGAARNRRLLHECPGGPGGGLLRTGRQRRSGRGLGLLWRCATGGRGCWYFCLLRRFGAASDPVDRRGRGRVLLGTHPALGISRFGRCSESVIPSLRGIPARSASAAGRPVFRVTRRRLRRRVLSLRCARGLFANAQWTVQVDVSHFPTTSVRMRSLLRPSTRMTVRLRRTTQRDGFHVA